MDIYTVLLVDDEEEVIQVIQKKINWEGLGFSVIGYANNGVKALEMVEEYQPDVVMTDIKMPYMDGLELSKRIKTDFPATKVLIFTGFDEFEYAKEAVHLEIEEYILKPVNSVELTNVFTSLKIKLDQEISEKRSAAVLKNYYMESLPFLKANFYTTLIEGRIRGDEVEKYLRDYQIEFEGPYYCCLVIHTSSTQVEKNMNPVLLAMSVQKQAKEYLGEKWKAKRFTYLGNMVMLAQLENENDVSELTDECDRFCRYARRIIGAVVTVGVGWVCSNILELSQSYSSAREAVSYRAIYGTSRAINIREIAPQETGGFETVNDAEISNLFKMIRLNSKEDIIEEANKYMNHIFLPTKSLQYHHIAVMELVSLLYRFAANNDIQTDAFSGDMGELYSRLIEMAPDALRKWFVDICLAFQESLISTRNKSTKSFVLRAQEYVHDNYADAGLSLDSVCEELGVSNSYFSTIFKKETGSSFISYLTDYRMDQAARWLLETNEKSYIIAKKVGYTDANYFSYVFKRQFGVSPSKYRTEHGESER
ncbi:DNA-binding response regulator [Lachnoclostridium sp. An131]|uniref:response regulator n=1 Tax=Lachnoclostridium sp. An131 TaxID=1965555 RepID=UPI000B37C198|nr:response regulator [Lachnoclostridium sp. An131]OUQ28600.1 DNA-binding response regulator [Lachnoclostridium sp. An131]